MKVLQQRLEGTLEGATTSDVKVEADPNRQYAMKYLDLIDANDSNLLVCAQGRMTFICPILREPTRTRNLRSIVSTT